MKTTMRLDKYLADMQIGTRTEVKNLIKKGRVQVNNQIAKQPEVKVDIMSDEIMVDRELIAYAAYEYYMLNKPAGVITASNDKRQETVLDLIDDKKRKDLFPVGRLDKDTTGLLLITNDGDLAHKLLAPKKHVDKCYEALVDGLVTEADVTLFAEGLQVDEEWQAEPADLVILNADSQSLVHVIIHEGKFHQIKRMFETIEKPVLTLKRLSMGPLTLDETLTPGEYRQLTDTEYNALMVLKGSHA